MNVYIFSNKPNPLKNIFPKNVIFLTLTALPKHSPESEDISYIDVSGLSEPDLKKALTKLKTKCNPAAGQNSSWGIVDPKNSIKDISALFFDGASDYLGAGALKKINIKRIKEAQQWGCRRQERGKIVGAAAGSNANNAGGSNVQDVKFFYNDIRLPLPNVFPGWKKIKAGTSMPFYILYGSVQGKTSLDVRFNEKTVAVIHKRFVNYLEDNLCDSDGLLWMNSSKDCLFLFPPKAKCAEDIINVCFKMLIAAPLLTMEVLKIPVPANFVLALHYGTIKYKPPGQTGTVVSDAVNFVFHLGTKKAEPGRLTLSGELPGGSVPKALQDCFIYTSDFEGRNIRQSKKFVYPKEWV